MKIRANENLCKMLILFIAFVTLLFFSRIKINAEDSGWSITVNFYDSDTEKVIHTEEMAVSELATTYAYEPPYIFKSEGGESYILDVNHKQNIFCVSSLKKEISVYYKKGELAEGKTAAKIRYIRYDEPQGEQELIGLEYVEDLNIGDSFTCKPGAAFQLGDIFFPPYFVKRFFA